MRKLNTDAYFAAMKQPKSLFMMVSNTLANFVAIRQLQTKVLKNIKSCMKESDTLAKFVAIKQLKSKL